MKYKEEFTKHKITDNTNTSLYTNHNLYSNLYYWDRDDTSPRLKPTPQEEEKKEEEMTDRPLVLKELKFIPTNNDAVVAIDFGDKHYVRFLYSTNPKILFHEDDFETLQRIANKFLDMDPPFIPYQIKDNGFIDAPLLTRLQKAISAEFSPSLIVGIENLRLEPKPDPRQVLKELKLVRTDGDTVVSIDVDDEHFIRFLTFPSADDRFSEDDVETLQKLVRRHNIYKIHYRIAENMFIDAPVLTQFQHSVVDAWSPPRKAIIAKTNLRLEPKPKNTCHHRGFICPHNTNIDIYERMQGTEQKLPYVITVCYPPDADEGHHEQDYGCSNDGLPGVEAAFARFVVGHLLSQGIYQIGDQLAPTWAEMAEDFYGCWAVHCTRPPPFVCMFMTIPNEQWHEYETGHELYKQTILPELQRRLASPR